MSTDPRVDFLKFYLGESGGKQMFDDGIQKKSVLRPQFNYVR